MCASVGRLAIGAQWALAYKAHNVSAFLYPVFAISPRYLTSHSLPLCTSSHASTKEQPAAPLQALYRQPENPAHSADIYASNAHVHDCQQWRCFTVLAM